MELQWDKKQIPCLRTKLREVQNQEQTLEVRLSDEMPDIGRIICGWGQSVIRSKEWRSDGMTISGGVMAWILYAPEDGSAPRSVESWLPFSVRWSFASGDRDGIICGDVKVRAVDARVLSARKMMVRTSVSALGEALEPMNVEVYAPMRENQDVQLLVRTYPMTVAAEAGEKAFLIDEEVQIGGNGLHKIISCCVNPILTEQKIVGGKAIFRGECLLHLVYFDEAEELRSEDFSIPFAQYADLDRDYDKEAGVTARMVVSSLEPERMDGLLRIKCGLVVQYVVLEKHLLELAQDAYSGAHDLMASYTELEIPVVLDRRNETIHISQTAADDSSCIVDVCGFWEQPVMRRNGTRVDGDFAGIVQALCKEDGGQYRATHVRCNHQWTLEAGEKSDVYSNIHMAAPPVATTDGASVHISAPLEMEIITTAQEQVPMIMGIELGQRKELDPGRPSLVLRRSGADSLWDMAKQYGSTVDAIKKANGLDDYPAEGQILLIPIP